LSPAIIDAAYEASQGLSSAPTALVDDFEVRSKIDKIVATQTALSQDGGKPGIADTRSVDFETKARMKPRT
jgi:hypothetical protein